MQSAPGIFGSAILEVAIGLIFLYFILSVICSSLTELVASLLQWRANDLEKALQHLLGSQSGIYQTVVGHPLITSMGHNRGRSGWWGALLARVRGGSGLQGRPAYLPASTFRTALLDAVANHGASVNGDRAAATIGQLKAKLAQLKGAEEQQIARALGTLIEDSRDPRAVATSVDALKAAIEKLPVRTGDDESLRLMRLAVLPCAKLEELREALEKLATAESGVDAQLLAPARSLVDNAIRDLENIEYDLDKLQRNVEAWFDNAMDRMSGVYKRHVQAFLLLAGLLITLGTGADTLRFATTLWANPTVRSQLVSSASAQAQSQSGAPGSVTEAVNDLAPFSLLFGYSDVPSPERLTKAPEQTTSMWLFWVEKVVGLTATALAIMMGGPFWFQLLQKLVNVRSAGPKPKRSDESAVETSGT